MLCAFNRKHIIENDTIKKINDFLYSDYYFLSITLLVVLLWGLGQLATGPVVVVALTIMLLIIAAILVLQKDVAPVLFLALMTMCVLPTTHLPKYLWVVAIPAGIVACAAIFHIVYYRIEDFKFGKLFFPMLLFLVAILLGGIGSKLPSSPKGMLMGGLLLAIAPLFVYSISLNYANREKSACNYMARIAAYFGLAIVFELAIYYIFKVPTMRAEYYVPHLGWGVSNTIATYLLLSFPMCFYLYVKTQGKMAYVYLLAGLAEFVSVILTTSRGATIFGILEFLCTAIVTMFVVDKKKRKEYIIFAAIMLAINLAALGLLYKRVVNFISRMFSDGMNDSGRFELYREALACFFEYPIFGVGLGYIGKWDRLNNTIGIYMFHNTILQYCASLGLVGLTAYAYLYFARLEMIFERWNHYGLYVLMVFIGFEGYCLLNTGTIEGYPTALFIILVYGAQEIETKQEESKIYKALLAKLKFGEKMIKAEQ